VVKCSRNRKYRTFIRTGVRKAKNGKPLIATGPYKTVAELNAINPHYSQFDAFKSKQVYTFEGKIGATGGIYYESAASRPDLVLKDIKIFHPELLPIIHLPLHKTKLN
jgi:iron complex transport system substrate-binding protein